MEYNLKRRFNFVAKDPIGPQYAEVSYVLLEQLRR